MAGICIFFEFCQSTLHMPVAPILTPPQGCLLLFFGRLADLYGRKKGFIIGMCWQMVFAIGLGFAKSESHTISGRPY